VFMSKKVLSVFFAAILTVSLSGCGYDGHYRYPCQDPDNWENVECKPPVCEATGNCTKDLLGYDPLLPKSATIEEENVEEVSEETEEIEE
jgi:predicted small lipoprotein YifL